MDKQQGTGGRTPHNQFRKSAERSKEDRRRMKQASLLWLSQRIFEAADAACGAGDRFGYEGRGKLRFLAVKNILEDTLRRIDHESKQPQVPISDFSVGCANDDDCPDDYICNDGSCEPLIEGFLASQDRGDTE